MNLQSPADTGNDCRSFPTRTRLWLDSDRFHAFISRPFLTFFSGSSGVQRSQSSTDIRYKHIEPPLVEKLDESFQFKNISESITFSSSFVSKNLPEKLILLSLRARGTF